MTFRVGVIGGTGYTGSELSRILCVHPGVELAALTSRQNAGTKVSNVHTHLKGYTDLVFTEKISDTKDLDLVFVATPHGVAMSEVPALDEAGMKVIDLSGDYRLKNPGIYETWYGHKHTDQDRIGKFVYGLPELFRDEIKGANLVANPGCYATAAIIACAPIMKSHLVDGQVFIDGKSGTSGAGMVPSPRLHHPTCGESVIPYSVGTHRHTPEIMQVVNEFSGETSNITFVPHLVPIVRGIIASCYFRLRNDTDPEKVNKVYESQYGKEPFVHFVKEPSIRAVVGSNHAHVAASTMGNNVVSFGVLDNLVKGASGQAVQCMNLMLGLDETEGLNTPGLGV